MYELSKRHFWVSRINDIDNLVWPYLVNTFQTIPWYTDINESILWMSY